MSKTSRSVLLATAIFGFACGLALPLAGAESFTSAEREMDGKLEASLSELSDVRNTIAKQKVPLSRDLVKLEDEVHTLERRHAELLQERDARGMDLDDLRRRVSSLGQQDEFVNNRLNEFVRDFEGRLHISELPRYEGITAAAKLSQKNVNLDAEARRSSQVAVVGAALMRLVNNPG